MRPHYCMKNSSRQDEKNRVKWEHGFWELIRNFLFSTYNRRSRIFEVPIWHLKNTRARKKRMDEVADVRYRMYLQSREYQC